MRNITVVNDTITTFFKHLYNNDCSTRSYGKNYIHTLSVEGQSTKAVLVVFFICQLVTIFAVLSLPKPPVDHRWSADHSQKYCKQQLQTAGGRQPFSLALGWGLRTPSS
jgi:hypothetical protein